MKIIKKVQGKEVILILKKIKDYKHFTLYQIFNTKGVKLYKQCFTKLQLSDIKRRDYRIEEEENE